MILVPTPKVKVTIRSAVKSCLSNNSKTTEANLTKLHRKIEHNEKVCRAKELGSYAQGQGHNRVKEMSCARLWFGCVQGHSQGSRSL